MTQKVHALVVAAGKGSRFGADKPKQYMQIDGKTILEHSLGALACELVDSYTLVVAKDDAWIDECFFGAMTKPNIVMGGIERWQSVKQGVLAIAAYAEDNDLIAIHDAARPCLCADDLLAVIERAKTHKTGAILAVPVADTLKQVCGNEIVRTVSRDKLWQAQTPQVFRVGKLLELFVYLDSLIKVDITDEASGFEQMGLPVAVVQGSRSNIKLTHADDLALVRAVLHSMG
ncbi:MAG: 2-C-methyl-D-erythritol 4-phosphate cytidylyltransferase [Moraxella sp.]|nr:2-C-methyl-D-erythritol 4-phosphate cytidylyltransferase [Moraxella sp.]